MKMIFKLGQLWLLVVALSSAPWANAQGGPQQYTPTPAGWLSGGVDAINFESRQMIISEKRYRVALKAKISDMNGRELSFSDMDLSYAIDFELEPKTGDILNIKIVAYP